ncbi:MAG: D-alanine--D-alanine ligase [Ruminococcaceae bacterium]|nr:D-alanine--D-alanine ligase [Oscillospiraceae bacterium]
MNKINFCCLFGGNSSEYEVSLKSAYGVITNTDSEKYSIIPVGITRDGSCWYLYGGDYENIRDGKWIEDKANLTPAFIVPGSRLCLCPEGEAVSYLNIDVAFPVMHGSYSEDGRMQGLLDMCSVSYVGPGCVASGCCMDKAITKQILKCHGIPQARAICVLRDDLDAAYDRIRFAVKSGFGYPVFVKPACAGSSVGVSRAGSDAELRSALETALAEDDKALIEEYIDGREIEVAVMGNGAPVASVCGEIDPGATFYDYETKYCADTASYYIPARLEDEVADKVRALAVKIYKAMGCKGLSRVDFFVKADNTIIFNEINTLPGFTPISMYPKLFMHSGMSYTEVIDRLLCLAME